MESIVPFVLGLIVTAGVLVPLLLRWRDAASDASRRVESLQKDVDTQRQARAQLESDLSFITRFLKELPQISRGLYGGVKERKLPKVVLDMVNRSLQPAQAAVLVRRKSQEPGGNPAPRLVVAAVSPADSSVAIGADFPMDQGELGIVAEAQIPMSRADLSSEAVASRLRPAEQPLGLRVDLIAPMVFDQETLGIIVLEGVGRDSGYVKGALQVIAQTGAQALSIAAAYGRMKVSAELDGLTGVCNKGHLNHMLSELIYTAACAAYDKRSTGGSGPRKLSTVSVFLFDIDHFKNYNDVNGHLAGDRLLQQLAELVQNSIRSDDIFGRFGGEEFLLILPNVRLSQAVLVAEKLRRLIASHPFAFAASQPLGMLSISGGVAEYPFDGLDAASLVKTADDALYRAKGKGRNQVVAPARQVTPEEPADAAEDKPAASSRRAGDDA